MKPIALAAVLLGGTALCTVPAKLADAAAPTASFKVSATVPNQCTITADPLDFGPYGYSLIQKTTNIYVNCTKALPATIFLDAGKNADSGSTADVPKRRMRHTASNNYLNYELRRTSYSGPTWGDVGGSMGQSYVGTGLTDTQTVYGQLLPGQTDAIAGTYNDTVTATVVY